MNLSDCKTIEEYREAAHFWQKKWAVEEKKVKECGSTLVTLKELLESSVIKTVLWQWRTKVLIEGKDMTYNEMIDWTLKFIKS